LQILEKTRALLQKRAVKSKGTDLIRRIEIQRTRSNAAAGERLTGIDPESIRSGPQDVHRVAQDLRRQLAAARGRRRRGSRRRRTVSGGATGKRRRGAPLDAGSSPGRRQAHCEHHGRLPEGRRRGAASHGEQPRRRGAPLDAGSSPGRRQAHCEHHGRLPEGRRRGAASHGEQSAAAGVPRWQTGEVAHEGVNE
jgi:hypothetical protein